MSRREFHFSEGSSNKFWAITVEGQEFTVEFGRVGTKGQTQTKQFASDAAAQQAADKLIAEKTKKGYKEVDGAAPPSPPAAAAPVKAKAKKRIAESAAPAPACEPAAASLTVERVLALDPEDWHRATWRPRRPLEQPDDTPVPYAQPALLKAMKKLVRAEIEAKEFLMALDKDSGIKSLISGHIEFTTWAARYLIPYLPDSVVEDLRRELRTRFQQAHWPTQTHDRPAMVFYLAALCGLHDEVLTVVESLADDTYTRQDRGDWTQMPQQMIFGLGEPRLVDRHMRRLKLRLRTPEHLRAWLAHTELTALDYVSQNIQAETNKNSASRMIEVFRLVKAPEAAGPMLELKLNSKASASARQWFEDNPGDAIAGLIPVAASRGKLAEAALDYLREAKQQGHGTFLEQQLQSAPPEIAARVRQEVLERVEVIREAFEDDSAAPAWLRAALTRSGQPSALPSWVRLTNLPPLVVGDRRLNDGQTSVVLSALRQSPLGTPAELVKAIKEHIDPAARDSFVWKLFEMWLNEGAPSKEKWALLAIGHLGDNASALKLTPLLRAWPGESQHQRAVTGLECLRAIGSDTALMQLNGIAQKLKFQGLKKKAQEFMEAIAKDRGMSRTQLEDRIVPDLDLDERGTRVFDFGPRQFTVVLDADLKPVVRDEAGKLKSDLPKPAAKDDADKAKAALADWKILKKQLREGIKVQAYRLEQAMVTGRRWNIQEFEQLLVGHPLMINLVRRLVWGGYDKKGKLARTFRVTEERDYADSRDEKATLEGVVAVGIVHPLHLSEDERSAWGQVFGDYEIFAPFPQLGRPVLALEKDETTKNEIHRFDKVQVPGGAFMGTMEKLGWTRG
ncbi:MAG TPA: DUF4132 domain-containing protein, partial [Gemmataceae bacterium]|nr:DUF4132 domain-containing protein [Gemmataceae bacterium]